MGTLYYNHLFIKDFSLSPIYVVSKFVMSSLNVFLYQLLIVFSHITHNHVLTYT